MTTDWKGNNFIEVIEENENDKFFFFKVVKFCMSALNNYFFLFAGLFDEVTLFDSKNSDFVIPES